jgi:MFS family permease
MSRRALLVLAACFLTVFAAYSIRYSYGTLLPEMLPTLGISKAQAGLIYSCYFIAYTLLSPLMGLISDRYDMRYILAIFVVLMGLGTFLMQFATSLLQASLFFTLAGMGCAACWAPVMAVAQRWASQRRRGASLALVDAGSSLGAMSAGAVVPLAVAGPGWQSGWLGLGVLAMSLGLINYLFIRSRPPSPSAETGPSATFSRPDNLEYRAVLKDRRFWLVGVAYLFTGFSIIIPFNFLSTFAFQELDFSYNTATRLITIVGLGATLGKLSLGPLSDRLGRLRILWLCALLITFGCLGIVFSRSLVLTAFVFVFGVGYGACWSMYAALASDYFSSRAAGGIIGLWTFLLGVGSVSGPIAAGWSADAAHTLKWAFVIAAAAGALSFLFLLPLANKTRAGVLQYGNPRRGA